MKYFNVTIFLILILFTSCNQYTTETIESIPEEYQGKFFLDDDGNIDERIGIIIGSEYALFFNYYNEYAEKIFIKNITLSKNKSELIFIVGGDVERMIGGFAEDGELSEIFFYDDDTISLKFSALISNKFKNLEFNYYKGEQDPMDNSPQSTTSSYRRQNYTEKFHINFNYLTWTKYRFWHIY